jgi:polar amino acid transport system substrate-binding protein
MTSSDDSKVDGSEVSEDRREALRYAFAIGSGAALASALASPASAQAAADNTLDRIRANKVLRIAVLPGELPYFNKDLATGTWSGFAIEMANDIAKLLDVKLEYTESTYGNSILDLQSNKIDLGFALNPTPQRALVVDFCGAVFQHPLAPYSGRGWKPEPGPTSTSLRSISRSTSAPPTRLLRAVSRPMRPSSR